MYRVLLTVIALSTIPVAFSQTIEVAACKDCKREPLAQKPPTHILIKASCALSNGTVIGQQLIEVDGSLTPEKKRAAAERACQPILDEANAKCDTLANQVDAMKREWRLAELHSYREHQLASEIKKALAAAPAYCREGSPK